MLQYSVNELINLLSKLVEINTVNNPLSGLKPKPEAARFIRDYLVDYGLNPEVIESNGYYTVYECIGEGKPIAALIAHYDTVPFNEEEWSYHPLKLTVKGDRGYGRGALDDKSNVAALMIMLREIARSKSKFRICYAFTGDEEIGGYNGARVVADKLARENKLPKYLINADGHGMKVIARRRGVFKLIVSCRESPGRVKGFVEKRLFKSNYPVKQHSHAAYFIPGVDTHPLIAASTYAREYELLARSLRGSFLKENVIPSTVEVEFVNPESRGSEQLYDECLTRILLALEALSRVQLPVEKPSEYGVSITPNMYTLENGIHKLVFDIRAMISDKGRIERVFREVVEELGYELDVEVKGSGEYQYTPRDSIIIKAFMKALELNDLKPKVAEGAGASDSRHFTRYGVEAVDFGPYGGGLHGVNEFVVISSLAKLPRIYFDVLKIIHQYNQHAT